MFLLSIFFGYMSKQWRMLFPVVAILSVFSMMFYIESYDPRVMAIAYTGSFIANGAAFGAGYIIKKLVHRSAKNPEGEDK